MSGGIEVEEQQMDKAAERGPHARRRHNRGLLMIGLVKLVEAAFFFLAGIGAFHLVHRDLADEAVRLANRLRVDPDGRLVSWVLDHVDSITAHRLRQIGVATFFYAGIRIVEGWGLVLERVWAEWLVVGVTVAFLPWELYEIVRHADWIRIGVLLANLVVLAYLTWWLRRMRQMKRQA
jgi:uncharacterized membrane protein (DUF2068 family)